MNGVEETDEEKVVRLRQEYREIRMEHHGLDIPAHKMERIEDIEIEMFDLGYALGQGWVWNKVKRED